jgi:hypothetical protein
MSTLVFDCFQLYSPLYKALIWGGRIETLVLSIELRGHSDAQAGQKRGANYCALAALVQRSVRRTADGGLNACCLAAGDRALQSPC